MVRVPNTFSGGREVDPPHAGMDFGGKVFYIGDPVVIIPCLTCPIVCLTALRFILELASSLAWQTLCTDTLAAS
jgi:hypothetical protein